MRGHIEFKDSFKKKNTMQCIDFAQPATSSLISENLSNLPLVYYTLPEF